MNYRSLQWGEKGIKMTDKERLDFLQRLTDEARYTGKVILRMSWNGRGWRLHETEIPGALADVREAIDRFIAEHPDIVKRAQKKFPEPDKGPPAEVVPIPNYVGPPAEAVPIPNYVGPPLGARPLEDPETD